MRKIATLSLSAAAVMGVLTSQAWAPSHHLIPNAPRIDLPNFRLPDLNVRPRIGNLPNPGAVAPDAPPVVRAPDRPPVDYGQLPADDWLAHQLPDLPPGLASTPNLNIQPPHLNPGAIPDASPSPVLTTPPRSNYVNLQELPDSPRLNYGVLQPESLNPPMGQLPVNPNASRALPATPDAAPRYDVVPRELPAAPAKFSGLPIGDAPVVPPRGPRPSPDVTAVNNPPRVPAPDGVQNVPWEGRAPKSGTEWPKATKILLGTAGGLTVVALVAVGVSVPLIIEEVTGHELEGTPDDLITGVAGMYLAIVDGRTVVMGGPPGTEVTELLVGTGGKPAVCPAGSFYKTNASQQIVMRCDGDTQFTLVKPKDGARTADGQPYPKDAILMKQVI